MSVSDRSAVRFPMPCPECAAVSGMPYRAYTLLNGGVCVAMRCKECGHQWEHELTGSDPLVAPKSDRRQSGPRENDRRSS